LVSEGPEIRLRCRGIPYAEAQEEHGNGENNVQPNISHVVGNYAEDRLIAGVKSEHSHESVDDSEDSEERARGTSAGQAAHEKDRSRGQMDNIMREIDVKDAKQHWHPIRARSANSGNESENSNCQEDDTKKHSECFNHCETSCWFKTSRLWQFAPVAGKRKSRVNRNGHGQMLSKIDHMKLVYLLVAACLAIVVDLAPAQD